MGDPRPPACALTIAGSDSGGGAGIQADLKTFAALRVHGLCAVSAVTAQSTTEVRGVHPIPANFVAEQLDVLQDDFPIDAVKTGMLADAETVELVRKRATEAGWTLVVDPVMVASSGARLVSDRVVVALRRLISASVLVTPNLDEVEVLTGRRPQTTSEMVDAGHRLLETGARGVLVKGGHLAGDPIDVLVRAEEPALRLPGARIHTRAGHGTGCTYAAAITAWLARGATVEQAVLCSHAFVRSALEAAPEGLGRGAGPLHPLFDAYERLLEPSTSVDPASGRK